MDYAVIRDIFQVTPCLQELQLFKLQQENKTVGAPTDEKENPVRKNAREKREPVSSSMDEHSPAKRRKDLDQKNKKAYGNDKGQGANEVALVHDSKADSASTKETNNHSPRKPATDKDLRSFFSDVGGVVAIRILTDQDKRSRLSLLFTPQIYEAVGICGFLQRCIPGISCGEERRKFTGQEIKHCKVRSPARQRGKNCWE